MSVRAAPPDRPRLGSWEPALAGGVRERAIAHALRLGDGLRWADGTWLGPWLSDGAAGLAVLFAALAAATGERRYQDPAERYLALAADAVSRRLTTADPRVPPGADRCGLGRVLGCTAGRPRRPRRRRHRRAAGHGPRPGWTGPWDVTGGLLGIGVYALERATVDPRLLALVVRCLGYGDCTVDGAEADQLVAFAALAVIGSCPDARPRLARAAGALLAGLGGRGDGEGAGQNTDVRRTGVTAALALAAPLLGHPLVPQQLTGALRALPLDAVASVAEIGLDHGLAGVRQTLHRVAVATGSGRAWDAAGRCGRALVDRVDAGETGCGPGLLRGEAGVVLALLSLATDVASVWDRALLLS